MRDLARVVTWLESLKTTTCVVPGPYFNPMTPPLSVRRTFFFLSGGKARDLARVTKNHHVVVPGPYFDPMTPPLGVLKSQNRTSTHLGSVPGRFPTVLPL